MDVKSLALLTLGLLFVPASAHAQLRVGFSQRPITPNVPDTWTDSNGNGVYDSGEPWVDGNGNGRFDKIWIAGFQSNRPAAGIHDDVYAVAAVIDDGTNRVAIVTLDTIGYMIEEIDDLRNRFPSSWGINLLIVNSTHNHEGPDTMGLWGPDVFTTGKDSAHMRYVQDQIYAAVEQSIARLEPALLDIGEFDESQVMVHDTRRPIVMDMGVRVILFSRANGSVIGSIVNWANHVETMWNKNLLITSDFPGYLRRGLSQGLRYGDRIVRPGLGGIHMFVNGPIGGLTTTSPGQAIYDPHVGQSFAAPSWEKIRAQGYVLAGDVLDAIERGYLIRQQNPRITIRRTRYEIPVYNETLIAAQAAGLIRRNLWWWGSFKTNTDVSLVTLGGAWILTIPGELYPEIAVGGIETPPGADYPVAPVEVPPLRQAMQGQVNFLFGLSNDEIGYIIPKSEWDVDPPYLYNDPNPTYGEELSPGSDTAPRVHRKSMDLINRASR